MEINLAKCRPYHVVYSAFCSDSTFDLEAEIDAAEVGSVASDGTGFDISHVYEPGSSASTTSGKLAKTLKSIS